MACRTNSCVATRIFVITETVRGAGHASDSASLAHPLGSHTHPRRERWARYGSEYAYEFPARRRLELLEETSVPQEGVCPLGEGRRASRIQKRLGERFEAE